MTTTTYILPENRRPTSTLALTIVLATFTYFSSLLIRLDAMESLTNIQYAHVDNRELLLDLYLPKQSQGANLIVWLHGGAWSFGTKEDIHITALTKEGFVIASIDFRSSSEALFPAQVHDIKAALRFLRANADTYGYTPDNITIAGYSSGGHLAALVGVTNDNDVLEGRIGTHLETSSNVQAIIDYSGPSNFETILHQSTPHGVSVRAPALQQLLGKPVETPAIIDLVKLASPSLQVSKNAPPIYILHGVQDNQVPINQSLELAAAYQKNQRQVTTQWIVEGQHTSGEYFQPRYLKQVADFLRAAFQP